VVRVVGNASQGEPGRPEAGEYGAIAASVLLATRDRAELLAATLDTLCAQHGLDNIAWEVIVVDNGSTDETPRVLASLQQRLPLIVLNEPLPGKSRAINRGLRLVRGRFVLFIDDDIQPVSSWMVDLLAATERWPDYGVFCGPVIPLYSQSMPDWLLDSLQRNRGSERAFFGCVDLSLPEGPVRLLPNGSFMIRSTALRGMGYDESMGPQGLHYRMAEDTDLLLRLQRAGVGTIWVPSASVRHVVRAEQLEQRWLLQRAEAQGSGIAWYAHQCWPHVPGIKLVKRLATPWYLGMLYLAEWRQYREHGATEAERFDKAARTAFMRGFVANWRLIIQRPA
jgi:cellulose synthase/poly-beta-1,6-N-acetylglucosamine synthase-like glycosyltransferase